MEKENLTIIKTQLSRIILIGTIVAIELAVIIFQNL